ncbi:MAG: amino acid transporter [Gammaproteobacteria bacterium]|nr:amino acid transporter [Gammaproteobacteria bacterium]
MILDLFGYDRHGEIREIDTTLHKNALNTLDVSLAAMAFNAPAWISAASMSVLYSVVGAAAPLAILISFLFPMLVLALCLVYLTRQAPSAGGIFTFSARFLHPVAGTILGWAYTIACAAVVPMTAIIGTQYLQALLPGVHGVLAANLIGTVMIIIFMFVCLRGVTLTARVTKVLLSCELTVIVGLGLLGMVSPHVNVTMSSLFTPPGGWSVLGSGVLLGMWMLANFDSAINYIEEARIPVRTVQRSLLAVLSAAFLVYMIAAIGWQRAVPVAVLSKIAENGDGGPIAAVAKEYLPAGLTWIALFVVITSAVAGLQVSMTAGARTTYRMAREGHLPSVFGRTNAHRAPWVSVATIAGVAIVFVWYKPLSDVNFYYNAVVVTLALAYMSALAAFTRVMFSRNPAWRAALASVLPMLAFAVLGYLMYSAGIAPADPKDLYQAWYIGAAVLASSLVVVIFARRPKPIDVMVDPPQISLVSKTP